MRSLHGDLFGLAHLHFRQEPFSRRYAIPETEEYGRVLTTIVQSKGYDPPVSKVPSDLEVQGFFRAVWGGAPAMGAVATRFDGVV